MTGKRRKPLVAVRPVIIVDTREQTPLRFPGYQTVRATLHQGDYSIAGHEADFAVERKSLKDLLGTLTYGRRRFEAELDRLRSYAFRRVLVEAPFSAVFTDRPDYWPLSLALSRSIKHSIAVLEARYDIPFVFRDNRMEASRQILAWAFGHLYEHEAERRRRPLLPPPKLPALLTDSSCT